MKKQAVLLAAGLAAAAAQAQVYVTVAGGTSQLNMDCANTTSCDSSGNGMKLTGGYDLGNGFSLEAGFISFGKFRATVSNVDLSAKPTAFTLGGAFALPLTGALGLNARLGVAQVKTKLGAESGPARASDSESKAKAYAGVGLTYVLGKTAKFEFGADSTESEFAGEKGAVRLFSLGLTVAF